MRSDHVKIGRLAAFLVCAALGATVATTSARADIVGTLTCNVASGTGAVIGSQRGLTCTFVSSAGAELYTGSITRIGLDIGTQESATLVYNVVAAGVAGPGDLAGSYVGPGFGVTVGTGGGLQGLVGGNGNSITLQTIAATTSTGLNINAGVGALHLDAAGPAVLRRRHHHHHHHHHI